MVSKSDFFYSESEYKAEENWSQSLFKSYQTFEEVIRDKKRFSPEKRVIQMSETTFPRPIEAYKTGAFFPDQEPFMRGSIPPGR